METDGRTCRSRSPTMRRICSWSTTTAASAICCRASCSPRAIASPPRTTRRGARQARRPALRSADPRRDDAGRDRLRARPQSLRDDLERADPDADRARRSRKPHHRARDRRRRLCRQAVRAARTVAAHRQHPQARAARRRRRAVETRALRRFRVSYRRAANCERGDEVDPSHRPRARDAARPRRARRARPCRAWRSPATAAAINERAVDVQVNRLRRKIERDPANPLFVQTVRGIGYRLVVVAMTTLDIGMARAALGRGRVGVSASLRLGPLQRSLQGMMPKGLYARALLIIIAPMVMLQSVVAFVFMERHWNTVTRRLSAAVVQDIAALIDIYKTYPQDADHAQLRRIAQDRLGLAVDFLPRHRDAAAGAEAVLLAARPGAVGGDQQADRPAVLDRHRRPLGAGRDPHPARRHGDARVRAPQRRLCVELGDLPALDGRHLAGAARRSPSCSCATRSGRSCGSPTPPRASARAARCRTSGRAARARCAARRRPSSR